MTRGYFVLETKGFLHAAELRSDAYLECYGKEIIEAFVNNNEEKLLDTLRAKMNEKDRVEMDRYICPEWYRITKRSEAKDYIVEYGYVISAKKLKVYNDGRLLITMDRINAKEWLYLINHSDKVDACYFYSDKKLHSDYSNERKIYRMFENAFTNGVKASQFDLIPKKYSDISLSDDHRVDCWHRIDSPSYEKFLSFKKIPGRIKFIVAKEYTGWRAHIQLPYIRISILTPGRSERAVMNMLREHIKRFTDEYMDFLRLSNLYNKIYKEIRTGVVTKKEDTFFINEKTITEYINKILDYAADKRWFLQGKEFSLSAIKENLYRSWSLIIQKNY